jgi:excisionase family DNA binding protein
MGLRVRAAARDLGVAYSTLKRWIRSGTVRTVRTGGGHHRVADAEIDRLLARRHPDAGGRARPVAADMPIDALRARNRLPGFVEEVRIDGLLAQIRLRAGGQVITAVIYRRRRQSPEAAARRRRGGHRQVDGSDDRPSGRAGDRTRGAALGRTAASRRGTAPITVAPMTRWTGVSGRDVVSIDSRSEPCILGRSNRAPGRHVVANRGRGQS